MSTGRPVSPRLDDQQLLERLVAFDTTSHCSNRPLVDFICAYLDHPGVRITRQPDPDGTKDNLIITAGPAPSATRAGLVLSGHTDVVPPENEGWDIDPFTLTERDGRLYGRGACDMKGFLALAMNAFADRDPDRLRHPLVIVFTYDEELGTLGARHLVENAPPDMILPRHAMIGEPTSLRPVPRHKGHLKLRVRIRGRSAHSGLPRLGRNAIEYAAAALHALVGLRRELERETVPATVFPDAPYNALNIAQIRGGTAINVIPDRCEIDLGIRTLPGADPDRLIARARTALATSLPESAYTIEQLGYSPPMEVDPETELCRALRTTTGGTDGPGAAFATDAGWLQTLGLQTVLFGPGDIGVAHRPNEYVTVTELHQGAAIVRRMIDLFCCSPDPG